MKRGLVFVVVALVGGCFSDPEAADGSAGSAGTTGATGTAEGSGSDETGAGAEATDSTSAADGTGADDGGPIADPIYLGPRTCGDDTLWDAVGNESNELACGQVADGGRVELLASAMIGGDTYADVIEVQLPMGDPADVTGEFLGLDLSGFERPHLRGFVTCRQMVGCTMEWAAEAYDQPADVPPVVSASGIVATDALTPIDLDLTGVADGASELSIVLFLGTAPVGPSLDPVARWVEMRIEDAVGE